MSRTPERIRPVHAPKLLPALTRLAAFAALVTFVTCAAFAAGAQSKPDDDALRGKALGEVRTSDNKPWVGADVTLVSYPIPEVPRVGALDRVNTQTDERGRFRAPILRNRRYSVWATSGRRVSRAIEGAVAGRPVLLEEIKSVAEQACELEGRAAWLAFEPLHVKIVLGTENPLAIPVELDADNRFTLPAIPISTCTIEVLDKDGLIRHQQVTKVPGGESRGIIELQMSKPELAYLAVRDIKTEKGLPGATISVMHRGALTAIGKTDADGLAHLALPLGRGKHYAELFASAPGHAVAPFQRGDAKQVKTRKWKPLRDVRVARHANLNAGLRFRGRIMLDEAHPAANVSLLVRGQGMHFSQTNNRTVGVYRRVIPTDGDGRFELSSCLPEQSWRSEMLVVLSPRHVAALPEAWRRQLQPRIVDVFPLAVGSLTEVNDLGVLDLSALCPVRFSIVDHGGQPAPFASISLSRGESPNHESIPIGELHADRMGRALFLMRADNASILLVKSHSAIALHRVDVRGKAGDPTIADVKVELGAMWTVSGRIVDAKGEPVAGVTLLSNPNSNGGLTGGIGQLAEKADGPTAPAATNTARLVDIDDARLAGRMLQSAFGRQLRATTDEKGDFRFAVPPCAMQYRIYGSLRGKSLRSTFSVEDQSVRDLQFELR